MWLSTHATLLVRPAKRIRLMDSFQDRQKDCADTISLSKIRKWHHDRIHRGTETGKAVAVNMTTFVALQYTRIGKQESLQSVAQETSPNQLVKADQKNNLNASITKN